MEEGDETRQRALQVCDMRGSSDKGQRPPEQLHALNACGRQGGECKGGPPTKQRAPTARIQRRGGPQTQQQAPLAQG